MLYFNATDKGNTVEGLRYILQSKNIDGVSLEAIEKEKIVFPVNCDSIASVPAIFPGKKVFI